MAQKAATTVVLGAFGYGMVIALRQLGFGTNADLLMVDPLFSDLEEQTTEEGGSAASRWDKSKARLIDRTGMNYDRCKPVSNDLFNFKSAFRHRPSGRRRTTVVAEHKLGGVHLLQTRVVRRTSL